jgi:MSHA biogenesis protein MshO
MKLRMKKSPSGFTLIELITVIVIIGVLASATTTFLKFSTLIYTETTARDQLVSSARFVIERLNRDIRNALPNSLRLNTTKQCLEFMPIIESTIYTDIPVAPEQSSTEVKVIPFSQNFDSNWQAIVYPLIPDDVYTNNSKKYNVVSITDEGNVRKITLDGSVLFAEHSPTQRIYFINEVNKVSYCLSNNTLTRNGILMAEDIYNTRDPFEIIAATLQRNALVQIHLQFEKNSEHITFNNEVQVLNVP